MSRVLTAPDRFAIPPLLRALQQRRPVLGRQWLVMLSSLYLTLTANAPFWSTAITHLPGQWPLAVALALMLTGAHALLIGLLVSGPWARPVLALILLATASAAYYMQAYAVVLDADMLRNILHTDWAESRELLTADLVRHLLLFAGLPCALLYWVRWKQRPLREELAMHTLFLLGMWVLVMLGGALAFKDLSALFRNQHALRYQITPANYLYGLGRMLVPESGQIPRASLPVATDAARTGTGTRKPRLLVLVVGETVRAQNWGLNGYARQTTPHLAQMPLVNFTDMHACGSSTEVSLPCMFSPVGRASYDQDKIRSQQSVLHVLDRVGVQVLWRDNQSGCKDVCRGLPFQSTASSDSPLCDGNRCLDDVLFRDLATVAGDGRHDRLVVLHMLGNHGPTYWLRYPHSVARYQPACQSADLGQCSRQQIVNAYDNAIVHTDQLLAKAIGDLGALSQYDTALWYVADHGESLGEKGLYLHGMPYAIAPQEQLRVPMTLWFSPSLQKSSGLDLACLQARARQPASHDDLFPSLLGFFDIHTRQASDGQDLLAGCRQPGSNA